MSQEEMIASTPANYKINTLHYKFSDPGKNPTFVRTVTKQMAEIIEKYSICSTDKITNEKLGSLPLNSIKKVKKGALVQGSKSSLCLQCKPRFLLQVESYIQRKLQKYKGNEKEFRLQVYREAFNCLIYNFKTYKPLLQIIKDQYEEAIKSRDEYIRELEHLKKMLVLVEKECEHRTMLFQNKENEELLTLHKENIKLLKKISKLEEDKKSLNYINQRLQKEMEAEHLLYRDEVDARKLLLSDITDLQSRYALVQQRKTDKASHSSCDDPAILKLALKKCREDLSTTTKQLNEMIANYCDVVPRFDFDRIESKYNTLVKDYGDMKNEHEIMLTAHHELLEEFEHISKLNEELEMENKMLRRTATPRPDWLRCAEFIQGGITRWQHLSEGKTSDELVDVLLKELSGIQHDTGVEYFEGKGTSSDVPCYMRYNGPVKNRRLGKRDVSILIKDIWEEKVKCQSTESLENFVNIYFEQRFSIPKLRAEWAYNLADTCQRLAYAEHIGLFWGILCGQIQETVYHSQQKEIHRLKNALETKAHELGTDEELSLETFCEIQKNHFPLKSVHNIERLIQIVKHQLRIKHSDKKVQIDALFKETDEGCYGMFIQELFQQARDEQDEYVQEILAELGVSTGIRQVSVEELRRAFTVVDPYINQPILEAYLQWTFSTDKDGLKTADPLSAPLLAAQLQTGNIARVGKRI